MDVILFHDPLLKMCFLGLFLPKSKKIYGKPLNKCFSSCKLKRTYREYQTPWDIHLVEIALPWIHCVILLRGRIKRTASQPSLRGLQSQKWSTTAGALFKKQMRRRSGEAHHSRHVGRRSSGGCETVELQQDAFWQLWSVTKFLGSAEIFQNKIKCRPHGIK